MKIKSNSFIDEGMIDARYAMKAIRGGENISPHITISDIPVEAKSLAIVFVDRHPVAMNWIHWLVINIPPSVTNIQENASLKSMPTGSVELTNSFKFKGYGGPQPPKSTGVHQYELSVYAISEPMLSTDDAISERRFLDLAKNKILSSDRITAGFENR